MIRSILFTLILLSSLQLSAQEWRDIGGGVEPAMADFSYTWDENKLIVRGGKIVQAGTTTTKTGLVFWDGAVWKNLDSGLRFANAQAFCSYKGELYMGGSIRPTESVSGFVPIVKWNGQRWVRVPGVIEATSSGYVNSMIVYKDELYAAGKLQRTGGFTAVNCIIRWNGTRWDTVGGGVSGLLPEILSMAIFKDELYVAGGFAQAGSKTAFNIARWNGTEWNHVDTGLNGGIRGIAADDKNLYVFGGFSEAGGTDSNSIAGLRGIARWDGQDWHDMKENLSSGRRSIGCYKGEVYLGCNSPNMKDTDTAFIKWDGQNWSIIPAVNGHIFHLNAYQNQLILTGIFDSIGNNPFKGIAGYYIEGNGINDQLVFTKPSIINYPNPFSESTTFRYCIPYGVQDVQLVVFDVTGRQVGKYAMNSQSDTMQLDLSNLEAGVYMYGILKEGKNLSLQRMMIIR